MVSLLTAFPSGGRAPEQALKAGHGSVELERRHTGHIPRRGLTATDGFQGFGIFSGVGQQEFMGHADLRQQLAAARALRSQVNEGAHSRW